MEADPDTEDVNRIKVYLYKKIKKVADSSSMDLFEVVMYCLLDSINNLNELKGEYLGEAKYSKERDLILKWQHIYGSWGTMVSITTYRQPTLVHVTIFVCLALYTVATTVLNRDLTYINFTVGDGGDPYSYYDDWTSSVVVPGDVDIHLTSDWWYFHYYVVVKSIFQVLPFTWLFFISNNIGKPFQKGFPDATIISKEASLTQYQVANLMSHRAEVDAWEMTQNYGPLKESLDRANPDTEGYVYPKKVTDQNLIDNVEKTKQLIRQNRKYTKTPRQSLSRLELTKIAMEAAEEEEKKGEAKKKIELSTINNNSQKTIKKRKLRFKNVNF